MSRSAVIGDLGLEVFVGYRSLPFKHMHSPQWWCEITWDFRLWYGFVGSFGAEHTHYVPARNFERAVQLWWSIQHPTSPWLSGRVMIVASLQWLGQLVDSLTCWWLWCTQLSMLKKSRQETVAEVGWDGHLQNQNISNLYHWHYSAVATGENVRHSHH